MIMNISFNLRSFFIPLCNVSSPLPPSACVPPNQQSLLALSIGQPTFSTIYINGTMQYMSFPLLTFTMTILRFTHVLWASIVHSFLVLNSIPLFGYITIYLPTHLFPAFYYYKVGCYKCFYTSFQINIYFHFSWINTQEQQNG